MERIDQLTTILVNFGRPLAILALTAIALCYVISPGIQEWMMERRGMLGKVLFGWILLPAVATIVALFGV